MTSSNGSANPYPVLAALDLNLGHAALNHQLDQFSYFVIRHSEQYQLLGGGRQDLAPMPSHQNGVFDSNSSEAPDVGARFNCNHHAGLKSCGFLFADSRRLVDFEAQAVPGGMHKRLAKPLGFQYLARFAVHLASRHSGPYAVDGRKVGIQYRLVHASDLAVWTPDEKRSGHVAHVAVLARTHIY